MFHGMGGSGIGPVFLCLSCKHRAVTKFTKAGVLSLRYGDQYAPCSVLEMPASQNNWVAHNLLLAAL